MFEYDIAPVYVTEVFKAFDQVREIRSFSFGTAGVPKHSNPRDLCGLLRAPGERRPDGCADN
jgi:hypothetical protein